jgi:hypothetical protein
MWVISYNGYIVSGHLGALALRAHSGEEGLVGEVPTPPERPQTELGKPKYKTGSKKKTSVCSRVKRPDLAPGGG